MNRLFLFSLALCFYCCQGTERRYHLVNYHPLNSPIDCLSKHIDEQQIHYYSPKRTINSGCCERTITCGCSEGAVNCGCSKRNLHRGCSVRTINCDCSKRTVNCGCNKKTVNCGCNKKIINCGNSKNTVNCGCSKNIVNCGCSKNIVNCGCSKRTVDCGCSERTVDCGFSKNIVNCGCSKNTLNCGCSERTVDCGYFDKNVDYGYCKSSINRGFPKGVEKCRCSKLFNECSCPKRFNDYGCHNRFDDGGCHKRFDNCGCLKRFHDCSSPKKVEDFSRSGRIINSYSSYPKQCNNCERLVNDCGFSNSVNQKGLLSSEVEKYECSKGNNGFDCYGSVNNPFSCKSCNCKRFGLGEVWESPERQSSLGSFEKSACNKISLDKCLKGNENAYIRSKVVNFNFPNIDNEIFNNNCPKRNNRIPSYFCAQRNCNDCLKHDHSKGNEIFKRIDNSDCCELTVPCLGISIDLTTLQQYCNQENNFFPERDQSGFYPVDPYPGERMY